jgi:hypothetical protein
MKTCESVEENVAAFRSSKMLFFPLSESIFFYLALSKNKEERQKFNIIF